jgi:hypothetical protein
MRRIAVCAPAATAVPHPAVSVIHSSSAHHVSTASRGAIDTAFQGSGVHHHVALEATTGNSEGSRQACRSTALAQLQVNAITKPTTIQRWSVVSSFMRWPWFLIAQRSGLQGKLINRPGTPATSPYGPSPAPIDVCGRVSARTFTTAVAVASPAEQSALRPCSPHRNSRRGRACLRGALGAWTCGLLLPFPLGTQPRRRSSTAPRAGSPRATQIEADVAKVQVQLHRDTRTVSRHLVALPLRVNSIGQPLPFLVPKLDAPVRISTPKIGAIAGQKEFP